MKIMKIEEIKKNFCHVVKIDQGKYEELKIGKKYLNKQANISEKKDNPQSKEKI